MTDPYPDYYDYDYNQNQADIADEAADYNLGTPHSNDDGWFYTDDNDCELPNSDRA